jgi:hypothetical protein
MRSLEMSDDLIWGHLNAGVTLLLTLHKPLGTHFTKLKAHHPWSNKHICVPRPFHKGYTKYFTFTCKLSTHSVTLRNTTVNTRRFFSLKHTWTDNLRLVLWWATPAAFRKCYDCFSIERCFPTDW